MAPTVKTIKPVPVGLPGPQAVNLLQRASYWYKLPTFNYDEATGSAIGLAELPGNAIVVQALIHVITAFDNSGSSGNATTAATASISVPADSGAEVIWDAANTKLQSSGIVLSTGVPVITPDSGGYCTISYDNDTTTKGQIEIYLEIIQLEDRL